MDNAAEPRIGLQMEPSSGATVGTVRVMLRLEGLCVLVTALVAYSKLGFDWGTFTLFFLAPDVSLVAYLAGANTGAVAYNLAHSYIGAIACLAAGLLLASPVALGAGIIWCAHIGFDRALGYGLKYSTGFRFTHLGRIGRLPLPAPNPAAKPDPVR
jgi:hypothetical protein